MNEQTNNLINPDHAYISIPRTTGQRLRDLGLVGRDSDFDDMRRRIIAAMSHDAVVVEGSEEIHFKAIAVLLDKDGTEHRCYFDCVSRQGSPSGKQPTTTSLVEVDRMD